MILDREKSKNSEYMSQADAEIKIEQLGQNKVIVNDRDKLMTIKDYVDKLMIKTKMDLYPIGSIHISVNPANPSKLLGFGTWVAFGAGRTLVGIDGTQTEFDVVEETGGNKLLQAHTHNTPTGNGITGAGYEVPITPSQTGYDYYPAAPTSSAGGGDSQNLQPYIVVYMFKRTA